MAKSKVAVLKVKPETVLDDIERLNQLAGMKDALDKSAPTILKDNISWHFPFPAANTTPWQLEGIILSLHKAGYGELSCVQNKTVVTDAFKGEDLNGYVPILRRHGVPILYNFKEEDMKWIEYRPRAKMHVLDHIYPGGIYLPDFFFGKNIVHLPTVKCVAADTQIMLEDGTVMTIAELVRMQHSAASVVQLEADGSSHSIGRAGIFAMAADGSIRPFHAVAFSRSARNGRRVLRLRTKTGRTLTATADHRIWTPEGWVELGRLALGARVAAARRLQVCGLAQPLPQTCSAGEIGAVEARAGRTYTAAFAQALIDGYRDGHTVTALAASAGMKWQRVQHILRRHEIPLRRNVALLRVPHQTSPELWRWMGYVMAEGCVERVARGSDKLWWTNDEPAIRDEFIQLTDALFGLKAKLRRDGRSVYVYSAALGRFLEELGLSIPLTSGNKRVPPLLFRCSDAEIAAFLSGYLDGDGHVSAKQADLSATTKSEQLARDVQTLFARLGVIALRREVESTIPGRWTEPRRYHMVVVSGAGLARMAHVLTLRHPGKADRLRQHAERLAGSKQPSNWDVVPLPAASFRNVRLGLGLTQAATGRPSSVNSIEGSHSRPTPRVARQLVEVFEQHDEAGRFAGEIAAMKQLAHEDLAWDVVEAIEELDDDVELYDVTVPGADSFVANGLVVHNCHIYTTTTGAMKNAFGGLLATHRHYTHSWIHRTLVDLLAIQREIHAGLFAVMDGTTAGNGPGPRTMKPVVKDYMLASADQVAIDAVAAKMMGFDPMSLEYIAVAHEDGLGVGDPRDIEIVGDDVSRESWGFEVGDNAASTVGDVMWFGPLKKFQKLFFHTPLVNMFVFGSEAYHDYYRWPLKDRKVFESWLEGTHWGRLFSAYQKGETDKIFVTPSGPTGPQAGDRAK